MGVWCEEAERWTRMDPKRRGREEEEEGEGRAARLGFEMKASIPFLDK